MQVIKYIGVAFQFLQLIMMCLFLQDDGSDPLYVVRGNLLFLTWVSVYT